MDEKKECAALLKELRDKYKYEPDVDELSDEPLEIRKLKWIVSTQLDKIDSTIFLLYTETGSLRRLGSMLSVSHSSIRPEVNRIKDLIKNKLEEIKDVERL